MITRFFLVTLWVLAVISLGLCKQPNILLIIADDYGWNDIGYHGSEIKTPTLDSLAGQGVKLENYYVQPICTPTRSQLLSGRYQIHTGLQHGVILPSVPNALPKEIPTLADKLREVGYATHIVGKWHLGFYKSEYLPTNRGFDSFFGYVEGAEDYFHHNRCYGSMCGFDFYNNVTPELGDNGTYSAYVFSEQVKGIVKNHVSTTSDKPLFMYVPFQSVHAPLEVPQKYLDKYSFIKNKARRIYAGMVSALDEAVKNITDAYKENGLWNDTILVFSTDNGGQVFAGGNNYPLKGWKASQWEGGIRGVGFVHGKNIEEKSRKSTELMHVSDWFPTLLSLAGGNTTGLKLDGYNMWPTISKGTSSPRQELLHNIDPLFSQRGKRLHPELFDTRVRAAIRVGMWKLLTGDPGVDKAKHVKPPADTALDFDPYLLDPRSNLHNSEETSDNFSLKFFPNPQSSVFAEQSDDDFSMSQESPDKNVWLYNIHQDPYEYTDLSSKYPDVVLKLLQRLTYYNSTAVPCRYPPSDPNADPAKHGGLWGPWE